jgi:hypothetical protein
MFTNRDRQTFKFRAFIFLFSVSTSYVSFLNFTDFIKICSYRLESSTFSTSVADPDPGPGNFFGSGMENNRDLGFGMNIPDYFSKSLQTVIWVKNMVLEVLNANPVPGSFF